MAFNTAAGAAISIGTTLTSASADTYVAIGNVTNIPEFGRAYKEVDFSPLATRGVLKVKGSFDEGSIEVDLARDVADAGQIAALAALTVDSNYNFKVSFNDAVAATSGTVTMASGTPGAVTDTAHGFAVGTALKFTGGTLPVALTAGTTYYIVTVVDANTYNVSATLGGSAINFAGASSGTVTRTTIPAGSYVYFKAQVASFTSIIGTIDQVLMRKMKLFMQSGTLVENVHLP